MSLTLEEVAAYHEAGHAVMHIICGSILQYVSILRRPGPEIGGTKVLQQPGPYAPADGTVDMCMFMVSVAGAIAEELVTGVGYGSDRQSKSDYLRAVEWASRGGELSDAATHANVQKGWAAAEQHLMRRWSHVEALAKELVARKVLSGTEVISLLLDAPRVPYARARSSG